MSEPHETFVTWASLAVGVLMLLQAILLWISGWVLSTILDVRQQINAVSSRVSHIEGHLEVSDRGGLPFQRLKTE